MKPQSRRRRHASDVTAAIDYINEAKATLDLALEALEGEGPTPPPDGNVIPVAAGTPLQPVLDAAPDGSTLAVEPGTYTGSLVLRKPVTIQPSVPVPKGRATAAGVGVIIVGGTDEDAISIPGNDVTLCGLTVKTTNKSRQLVGFTGQNLELDRCSLLGDPGFGCHRGVMLNGASALVVQCHIDNVFDFGRDTQAISGWDGTRDIVIDDCYLEGAGEVVMFGGADSTSRERMPTNIRITNCTLTKNPEWYAKGVQIKNAFELKCAVNVVMENCILEYGGTAEGQGSYLILLSTRNQDGTAPWTTIQHVKISNCHCRYGGAGLKVLGRDDGQESVPMTDVVLDQVAFTDLDPDKYGGDARGVCILGGPDALVLENITIESTRLGTTLYLIPPPYPTDLVLRNMKMSPSDYGMKIDGGGSGVAAWEEAMPDAVIELTPEDVGATDYPQ
jgi:hypothetical protein